MLPKMDDKVLQDSEQKFEQKAQRTSLAVTIAFHVGVLMLFSFWTCTLPTPPDEQLIEITWEGGGGAPGVDAPADRAMRGQPNTQTQPVQQQQPEAQPRDIKTPETRSSSEETIPATQDEPQRQPQQQTPQQQTTEKQNEPRENPRDDQPAGQNPEGTGTKLAGGSGGAGVGFSVGSEFGTRGWVIPPKSTISYPQGSNMEGVVVLRFTVLPNGDIVNIVPVKRPGTALVNAAIAGMRRTKARSLPSNAEQRSVTTTITINFTLQ